MTKIGLEFENLIGEEIIEVTKYKWGIKSISRHSSENQDKKEGTDLFLVGVRTDITLKSLSEKGCIHKQENILSINGINISYGLRLSNGTKNFKVPVLVISFDVPVRVTYDNMHKVIGTLQQDYLSILENGFDYYFNATEERMC